jgi:oxaloacetate decarboxylase alpha subunit
VGLYCQGAAGNALVAAVEAARAGADRIACAVFPIALTVHRVSGEALAQSLAGLGVETGVDVDALWRASDLVDEYIGDEPVTPFTPRISVRAVQQRLPAGLVAALDTHLRANAAEDRLDDVLDELQRIRHEAGSPPLAAPIGQVLASQALLHVLSAERYGMVVDEFRALMEGRFGTPPAPVDANVQRAVSLTADDEPEQELDWEKLREDAAGLASSEEELILLALFGEEAQPLLNTIRARASGEDLLVGGAVDQTRAERIKDLVRVVQESGVAEITVEEGDMRVTVRRTDDRPQLIAAPQLVAPAEPAAGATPAETAASNGFLRVESPMVGTFYRASEPGAAPFVEEGDVVGPGQTLCILEAMKLMNHVKAEVAGTVRRIAVGNGEPVEYGQLLFELEPAPVAAPLDAV